MPGRDITFNLKVATGPQALADLKKFGDETAKVQKKITDSAVADAKRVEAERKKEAQATLKWYEGMKKKSIAMEVADEKRAQAQLQRDRAREIAERQRQEAMVAKSYLREHLKAIDEKKKAEIRAIKDAEREAAAAARRAAVQANQARMASMKRSEGFGKIAGGIGNIGRGLAYGGLIGEQNTQTVINTVAGVEAAGAAYRGGVDIAKGAAATTGIGLGAGGAAGASLAGIAAAVAWLPALVSAVKGIAIAVGGSSITRRGDIRGAMGEGIASTYAGGLGMLPLGLQGNGALRNNQSSWQFIFGTGNDPRGNREGLLAPYLDTAASNRDVARFEADRQRRQALGAGLAGMVSDSGRARMDDIRGNMGNARGAFRESVAEYENLKQQGAPIEAQRAAAENIRAIQNEILQLHKQQQDTVVSTARTQYELAKQTADESKRAADEAKRNYGSDLARFATASPEEQARLREIKRKQAAGESLTGDEIRTAQGYKEFGDLAQSEAERRAIAAGAGDIFTQGRSDSERLAKEAATAAKAAAEAKVTLEEQLKIQVELKDNDFADPVLQELKPALEALQAQRNRDKEQMRLEMLQMLRAYANGKRPA